MGTKFASYSLKLALLHEYYQRITQGGQPIPSGLDVASTLKYFQQSLLSLLKDVEESPYDMLKSQRSDPERLALYPNLDYRQLYNAISQLIDVAPCIQNNLQGFGLNLLQCLTCLLPFLENDSIDNLPYLTASLIAVLPDNLHQKIVNNLCFYMLPFTIGRRTEEGMENYASQSISAVLMIVFEYSDNLALHCQLIECIMALKRGIAKDILCIIAYGTPCAKLSATKLLFHYWPLLNLNLLDRQATSLKSLNNSISFVCQRDYCPNAGNAEAAKVCYDHTISIKFATDSPPPMYICIECANEIHRENPHQMFFDILHPIQQIPSNCENKNCRANEKSATCVCFSSECTSYNSNHPIYYCQQCHNTRHSNNGGDDHIFHTSLDHISQMDAQMQVYTVQAIISLLTEAEPASKDRNKEIHETCNVKEDPFPSIKGDIGLRNQNNYTSIIIEERQLLGQYGIWLLMGVCSPDLDLPQGILTRILSVLFHWFHATAYPSDDTGRSLMHLIFSVGQVESTLEKLKTEYIYEWLSRVIEKHHDVFISCLLPYPIDCVRVGGHWETLQSRTSHLRNGLSRLFCLVPYEILSPPIWDHVMPHWIEAIVNDVPDYELQEMKITLRKMLDPEMCSLGFSTGNMYNFIAKRFNSISNRIQEQALNWLQTMTKLKITIPLPELFQMFNNGITANKNSVVTSANTRFVANEIDTGKDSLICHIEKSIIEESTSFPDDSILPYKHVGATSDEELNVSCCIIMLDILLRQMELQKIEKYSGVDTPICKDICHLLESTNISYWSTHHTCDKSSECYFCELVVIWHQLSLQLLSYVTPNGLAHPPDNIAEKIIESSDRNSPSDGAKKEDNRSDVVISMPVPEMHSVGGVLIHMPHFFEQIMTATVETVSEQLDLANLVASDKESAPTRSILPTETGNGGIQLCESESDGDEYSSTESSHILQNYWVTSKGKFKFCIEELPDQLQYVYKLFKELIMIHNSDIQCYMLQCLNLMCLHGDILNVAAKFHQGFLIWIQENLIIRNLWELLNAEYSHIAQMAVPLLLYCIDLLGGSEAFWKILQDEFHNVNWYIRFSAVERVVLIARFMDNSPLKNAVSLQSSLANAFCFLINSMDDNNIYVAQKATLYLGTIHDTAMRALLTCMETQFDLVIIDRPIILQSLYQLHNGLSDRRILTWEFFVNRFDALFIEAQIHAGDLNDFRDLENLADQRFMKKLQRAREAISQSNEDDIPIKTLSASFNKKWPHRRTISSMTSGLSSQEIISEKDKMCNRQYSAPNLKRKSSKFGLSQLIGHTLPTNSLADIQVPSHSTVRGDRLVNFPYKIIDLEMFDKQTIHLLIFLLMQFLSRPDQVDLYDEKSLSRTQGIVIRHLYLLLGYNSVDRSFHITPQKLRSSAVFNVVMMNLPQVLDQNHAIGSIMIQPFLAILRFSPCPPQRAMLTNEATSTYSLWHLEGYSRRSWLMALLVIHYKYEYKNQLWWNILQALIRIVLFTLRQQQHRCEHIPASILMANDPSKIRDTVQTQFISDDAVTLGFGQDSNSTPIHHPANVQQRVKICLYEPTERRIDGAITSMPKLGEFTGLDMNSAIMSTGPLEMNDEASNEKTIDQYYDRNNSSKFISPLIPHIESIENKHGKLSKDGARCPLSIPVTERLLPIGSSLISIAQMYEHNARSHILRTSRDEAGMKMPSKERLLPIGPLREKIHSHEQPNDHGEEDPTKLCSRRSKRTMTVHNSLYSSQCEKQRYVRDFPGTSMGIIEDPIKETTNTRKQMKQLLLRSENSSPDTKQVSDYQLEHKLNKECQSEECKIHRNERFKSTFPVEHGDSIISFVDPIMKPNVFHCREEMIRTRCSECGSHEEEYNDEELGLSMIILGTFIHREPYLAAPLLPRILEIITELSLSMTHPWQIASSLYLPGCAKGVAHQSLRCVFHQMAPNGIFLQMFQTDMKGSLRTSFFKSIVQALSDFNELNPIAPLQILVENINTRKLPLEHSTSILHNVASYLECLPLEIGLSSGTANWSGLILQFDGLFRQLTLLLPTISDVTPILRIMSSLLRLPGLQQFKGVLDSFSKVLSYIIQNHPINYPFIVELCCLCHRNFMRDRDKYYLSRTIIFELMQAIKFKTILPDTNLLLLLQFILQGAGGHLLSIYSSTNSNTSFYNINATESLRNQMTDLIEFLMDFHTSVKIKSYSDGLQCDLNGDTLCGILKCGLAQYIALEITKGNNRENRAIMRYLPWLSVAPSSALLGSREYLECVGRMRLLSWLLLGSLTHSLAAAKSFPTQNLITQPIPQETSCHIAEHIQFIISTFPEQYRSSKINISSLFHAFNLCQLWTLYLEVYSKNNLLTADSQSITSNILMEFWGKVTVSILQIVSHSKMLADVVNLHFSNLLEMLLDCGCSILNRLLPIWHLILFSHHIQVPKQLRLRLQYCQSTRAIQDIEIHNSEVSDRNVFLIQWLQRLQFKMGQVEIQSSNAALFYSL